MGVLFASGCIKELLQTCPACNFPNCSPCELGLYLNISAWFNAAQPRRVQGAEGSSGRLSELLLALICALLHSSQIPRAPWRCERGRECSNSTSSG